MKRKNTLWGIVISLGILLSVLTGCSIQNASVEKLKELEFTILSEEKLPEELLTMVEERKERPFKFTFCEDKYLYICVGYGKQESGGYSISVQELFLAKNAIYVDTSLIGPSGEDAKAGGNSYPYIVICTENLDKTVVFE